MNRQTRIFSLTRFELSLWLLSLAVMLGGYALVPDTGLLNLTASLIGVTALIYVAKGAVIGQVLTVVFAVFYGIISLRLRYYGEMITYLGMSAPMAMAAVVAWIRHPFRESGEVEVASLSRRTVMWLFLSAAAVTGGFYFILAALGTAQLPVSTVSVTTSYLASALTFLRSPYYALAYSANDVVLVVLWVLASITDPRYFVMAACFLMFLLSDLYGFFNWRRMKQRQRNG